MGAPTSWTNRRSTTRARKSNLVLRFRYPGPVARTLAPLASFRIDGAGVRATADGPVLAYQRDQLWHVGGSQYARLECNGRIMLAFEAPGAGRASQLFGPYRVFSCAGGIAHADHTVFAVFYEALGDWICYADRSYWQALIVRLAQD